MIPSFKSFTLKLKVNLILYSYDITCEGVQFFAKFFLSHRLTRIKRRIKQSLKIKEKILHQIKIRVLSVLQTDNIVFF